jgi:hypothetical protein
MAFVPDFLPKNLTSFLSCLTTQRQLISSAPTTAAIAEVNGNIVSGPIYKNTKNAPKTATVAEGSASVVSGAM